MTLAEIVDILKGRLPQWTVLFSSQVEAVSAVFNGSDIDIETSAAHGVVVNDSVMLSGFYDSVGIAGITSVGDGIYEVTTTQNHDLTLNAIDGEVSVNITIDGDSYTPLLTYVKNRKVFRVRSSDDLSVAGDGYLNQYHYGGVNSTAVVSEVLSPTAIKVAPSGFTGGLGPNLSEYVQNAKIHKNIRISAAIDIDTAVNSYTEQNDMALWAFVVMDGFAANRSKFNTNDAQDSVGSQQDFRQQVIGNFSVYVFVPNKGNALTDTNGRAGRDVVETIRAPLFKSLLNTSLSSSLSGETQNGIIYAGDGYFDYNGAVYIHRFQFQQVFDIVNADTSVPYMGGDRAFRDIHLELVNAFSTDDTGNQDAAYSTDVNLDDVPL